LFEQAPSSVVVQGGRVEEGEVHEIREQRERKLLPDMGDL
jgi:hypothetical protein